jgi:hypothetical protein
MITYLNTYKNSERENKIILGSLSEGQWETGERKKMLRK